MPRDAHSHLRAVERWMRVPLLGGLALALLAGPSRAQPGVPAPGNVPTDFEDVLVLGGFFYPSTMTFLPDGRLLVINQGDPATSSQSLTILPLDFNLAGSKPTPVKELVGGRFLKANARISPDGKWI